MLTPAQAKNIQNSLRHKVIIEDMQPWPPSLIAGVDVGYRRADKTSRAAIVLLGYKNLERLEQVTIEEKTPFPYVPGLLSFREVPVIIKALELLKRKPDLLMIDGHGIAHPRHLGIASHIGVESGFPTIGVAKKKLVGHHRALHSVTSGKAVDLIYKDQKVGAALCSKPRCNPLYVSPGHKISMEQALEITRTCLKGYKLPEPTRLADKLSKFAG